MGGQSGFTDCPSSGIAIICPAGRSVVLDLYQIHRVLNKYKLGSLHRKEKVWENLVTIRKRVLVYVIIVTIVFVVKIKDVIGIKDGLKNGENK